MLYSSQVLNIKNPPWQKLKHLEELLNTLGSAKIVGGAVRNTLINLPITDIDIACKLKPDTIKTLAEQNHFAVIPTGIEHGTVTCVKGGEAYEVTTLRADKETDGRHAKVEFVTSWKIDAERRDFTINGLFSDFEGNISDYVGGLKDIKTKLVRFIGNPRDRIREDYLRILRFFRFYAKYGKEYDPESLRACLIEHAGLRKISRERCTYEFLQILTAKNPWPTIGLMSNEIFSSAGLPARKMENIARLTEKADFCYRSCGIKTSPVGNLSIFKGFGELVLSKQIIRHVVSLQELKPMRTLKDYIIWINACYKEVLWDGIIIKGEINEEVLPELETWITNPYPLQGKNILELGVAPGPIVSQCLSFGLDIFASNKNPLPKDALLNKISEYISSQHSKEG